MTDVTENRSAPAPEPALEEGSASASIAAAAADTSSEQDSPGCPTRPSRSFAAG